MKKKYINTFPTLFSFFIFFITPALIVFLTPFPASAQTVELVTVSTEAGLSSFTGGNIKEDLFLQSLNELDNPYSLKQGTKLIIPNRDFLNGISTLEGTEIISKAKELRKSIPTAIIEEAEKSYGQNTETDSSAGISTLANVIPPGYIKILKLIPSNEFRLSGISPIECVLPPFRPGRFFFDEPVDISKLNSPPPSKNKISGNSNTAANNSVNKANINSANNNSTNSGTTNNSNSSAFSDVTANSAVGTPEISSNQALSETPATDAQRDSSSTQQQCATCGKIGCTVDHSPQNSNITIDNPNGNSSADGGQATSSSQQQCATCGKIGCTVDHSPQNSNITLDNPNGNSSADDGQTTSSSSTTSREDYRDAGASAPK
ncbi:MAG TPA: hypothetical protein PKK26_03140 [Candidatus Wallbacteria bacterium]|nr:hypothetical protein [Candidatus Wallbacteria bacterium]